MSRKSISKGKNKGIRYEEEINQILKDKGLQLGSTSSAGASDNPDGYFWFNGQRIPIEIKKASGDFAQIELRWEKDKGFFYSPKSKNLEFIEFLNKKSNFLDDINKEWTKSPKKFTKHSYVQEDRHWDLDHFSDIKKDIKVSYIEKFYNLKHPAVNYIQIQGKGFFFMGNDKYELRVPRLNGKPYLRARVKTRSSTNNKWGFLVAIKMPYIKKSKFDIEENDGRIFPIPEGDHIKGPIDQFIEPN